ncbi:MAG TPA: hypothetical protein VKQ36_02960, partial [Ktedonobacterales bacterium]|nr:hypothetical protein [Ktedonobacterales bacterium]
MTPGDRPRSLFDDPLRFRPDEKTSSLADNAGRFKPSANPPSLFDDPLHLPPAEKAPSIFDDPLRNAEAVLSGPQQPFEELKGPPISPSKAAMQRFFRDKPAMISLIVLLSIFFLSLVFPPIYEHIGQPLHEDVGSGFVVIIPPEQYHSPQYQDDARLTQLPSGTHWLGTDDSGQDILARMLKGMQVSLLVVIGIEIQDVVFGIFFGVLAGYFGGVIDMLLARFTDLMFAFPGLLFALLVVAIFGSYFD